MKVEDKGTTLVITIDKNKDLIRSSSGKTLIVASSGGNQPCGVTINGQALRVGVNAYIPAPGAPLGNNGGGSK